MSENTKTSGKPDTALLRTLGWNEEQEAAFSRYAGPYRAGRVISRHRTAFDVLGAGGSLRVGLSGALRRLGRIPAVGDYVVLLDRPESGSCLIVDILPRRSRFFRGAPGEGGEEQVIAANIDTVFIMTAAGGDFNLRRIERYLAIVHAAGARPVILVNKSDLAADPAALTAQVAAIAGETPVVSLSALRGEGLAALGRFLQPAETVAIVGSSGVGKSTLINALMETPVQETKGIREDDDRGRHTTTVRQLFLLPNGAMVIDNPGLREIQLGNAIDGIAETFADIHRLAAGCRYADCRHEHEPGCAVRDAVSEGRLDAKRLESYLRLSRELAFQAEKADIGLKGIEKKRYKGIALAARQLRKDRDW
ncbi:MAG: ribosome small subunit-dependent GTPase A [Methanomicrobiales archaeon]|nr:ribosome small subunit-dependent GTPase A [Methanomicrobiales archaeon]